MKIKGVGKFVQLHIENLRRIVKLKLKKFYFDLI